MSDGTTNTELLPATVMPLYASMDSVAAPPQSMVQFAHRLIEDAAISGGDLEPTTVEAGDLAVSIARAILAERERCAKVCEDQKAGFLSPEYASNQPLGSLTERFACDECAQAIRSSHE